VVVLPVPSRGEGRAGKQEGTGERGGEGIGLSHTSYRCLNMSTEGGRRQVDHMTGECSERWDGRGGINTDM
jgi:hypothetical protein